MKIEFANKRLALIQTAQAHKLGLPIGVVKSARDALNLIANASTDQSLRGMRSFDYKKLEASELRQIRLNGQYRMQFELDATATSPTVRVTFIGDPH